MIRLPGSDPRRERDSKPVRATARACGRCGRAFRGAHCAPCERARKLEVDARGLSAAARGYASVTWRRIRAAVLQKSPVCVACEYARASHVDHVVPRRRGGTDSAENLQALCASCHARKTAREDGGFGNSRRSARES